MTSKNENDLEQIEVQSVSGNSRRKALKKMLVGTGVAAGASMLPGKWVKPVVNKVLIPAHAQTSEDLPTAFYGKVELDLNQAKGRRKTAYPAGTENGTTTTTMSFTTTASPTTTILPTTLPPVPSTVPGELCVTSPDGQNFEAKMRVEFDGSHYFEASGTVGGAAAVFRQTVTPCGFDPIDLTITVANLTATGASIAIIGWLVITNILNVGNNCPQKPTGC